MVKDFKYIIKRILIGVGIAFALSFLNTQAMQVSSYSMGTNYYGVNNTTTRIDHNIQGNPWAIHANMSGYVNFNFSVTKVSGNSTAPLVQPRGVSVATGSNSFICNFGSVSSNNSTFNSQVYSVRCPVTMSSSGLTGITILFQDFQANDNSEYRVTLTSGMSFEIVENGNVNVNVDTSTTTNAINNQITNDNNNTQSIINNQNSNKQDVINNQNQNTQDIINNQNKNNEQLINTFKDCTLLDENLAAKTGVLYPNGSVGSSGTSRVTDFITIKGYELITVKKASSGDNRACFYNSNKEYISCFVSSDISVGQPITIPNNAFYLRFTLKSNENAPNYQLCKNKIDNVNNSIDNVNNTLNNDNVDSQQASDFFSNFQTDSHGLSGIITSPLRLIESLSSSQCSPLVLPLPFVNQSATIPCMSSVYSKFPTFYNLWQLITTGIIAYYILIKIFGHVKGMQNPNDDRIEVLNL